MRRQSKRKGLWDSCETSAATNRADNRKGSKKKKKKKKKKGKQKKCKMCELAATYPKL